MKAIAAPATTGLPARTPAPPMGPPEKRRPDPRATHHEDARGEETERAVAKRRRDEDILH